MKAIQITWKGIILVAVVGMFLMVATIVKATEDPRANRDILSARDRVAAFCDPADFPRALRGEVLDCSGFVPTNTPASDQQTQPQPTATPRVGDPGAPTETPDSSDDGDNNNNDDPCASGKSYTGDYCGWSPGVGGDGGDGSADTPRIGDPAGPIKGLSYTSGSELAVSDIILLTGVLCLLLYVRSKFMGGAVRLTRAKKRLGIF